MPIIKTKPDEALPAPIYFPFECNASRALRLAALGMDAAEKRALGARLDLQEPTCLLARRDDEGADPGRSRQGDVVEISTLALLVRMGDQDLIDGAIEGPFFVEGQVHVGGRRAEFDTLARVALREAMGACDAALIEKAAARLAGVGVDLGREMRGFERGEYGDAVWHLALGSLGRPIEGARACAKWGSDAAAAMSEAMFGPLEKRSLSAKRVAGQSSKSARAGFAQALLSASAKVGSRAGVDVALELGAVPRPEDVGCAFCRGGFELAVELSAHPGIPKAWEARAKEAGELRAGLCRALREERDDVAGWGAGWREGAGAQAGKLAERVILAAPPGEDRDELLAAALESSSRFENPAAWRERAWAAHPEPAPAEIFALAKAGLWRACQERMASVSASPEWREDFARRMGRMGTQWRGAHPKADAEALSRSAPMRLAKMGAGLGGFESAEACLGAAGWGVHEAAEAAARWDLRELEGVSARAAEKPGARARARRV